MSNNTSIQTKYNNTIIKKRTTILINKLQGLLVRSVGYIRAITGCNVLILSDTTFFKQKF